jgi:hypothetical protein
MMFGHHILSFSPILHGNCAGENNFPVALAWYRKLIVAGYDNAFSGDMPRLIGQQSIVSVICAVPIIRG